MLKLSQQQYISTRWKNAGGVTKQILIHPSNASLNDFDYRISIATVTSDGPFSVFPGVNRSLTIIGGGALLLSRANGVRNLLRASSEPIHLNGDEHIDCRVIDGPVTDCNVMTRRGFYAHDVQNVRFESMIEYCLMDRRMHVFILVDGGSMRVHDEDNGDDEVLQTGDSLVIDGAKKLRLQPTTSARLLHVQIHRLD